jgi:hypothetical protein
VAVTKRNLQTAVFVDVDNKGKPFLEEKGFAYQKSS